MDKITILLILFIIISPLKGYSNTQQQVYLYTTPSYSRVVLDQYINIHDNFSITTGIGYRINQFISDRAKSYFSFGLSVGGGMVFSQLRNSTTLVKSNTALEIDIFLGYGLGFGEYKQHQLTLVGASLLPKFYGLSERDRVTEIGGTEIEWFKGFYIPLYIGVALPSYRYVKSRFFIGFQHSVSFLIKGHENINIPTQGRMLSHLGYQFKFEIGYNYDTFSPGSGKGYDLETTLTIRTNRDSITISLVANLESEEAETMTVEMFVLENTNQIDSINNLIAYASKMPIFNGRSQFTKHWKGNNYLEEELIVKANYLKVRYKEIDKFGTIIQEKEIIKKFVKENENENNINIISLR